MPLRDTGGFLTVPAVINSRAVSLLVDTGAEAGLLTPEAASMLRLPQDPSHFTLMQGTGGDGAVSPHALVGALELGRLVVSGLSVPLGPLPAVPRLDPPVAGLLGADLLAAFDVEIDIRRQRLGLYQMEDQGWFSSCAGAVPASWVGSFDTTPLRRVRDRLFVEVIVNGRSMTALIDTGARSIILSTAAAQVLGIGPRQLERDPGGITGGVDMREVMFHWHRFDSLQIGREVVRGPVLTVSSFHEDADMLLGSSYFATRLVWLSYATSRMFVQS